MKGLRFEHVVRVMSSQVPSVLSGLPVTPKSDTEDDVQSLQFSAACPDALLPVHTVSCSGPAKRLVNQSSP